MPNGAPDRDYTVRLAEETVTQIRTYNSSGDPRSFEVWYTHLSGRNSALTKAVNELVAKGAVAPEAILELHEKFLSPGRFALQAEQTGIGMLAEIDKVVEMVDVALGSTNKYGNSLEAISADLTDNVDRNRLRELVGRLVAATRETVATNRQLETRLKETRGEIQDLRETLESIRTESLTDPLTSLSNRKHLDSTLANAVSHAALTGEPLTLLMIDVDKFKDFNDTWGHLTGDQVLRLVAMSIKGAVRPTDTAARFGGEEFAIVLPQSSMKSGALVAERIRQTVMSRELVKRSTGEALGRLTVSIGIACFAKGDTPALLIERADKCLLAAKRTGRNKCVCENELDGDALSYVA
jgi:diguanylate cyclase